MNDTRIAQNRPEAPRTAPAGTEYERKVSNSDLEKRKFPYNLTFVSKRYLENDNEDCREKSGWRLRLTH